MQLTVRYFAAAAAAARTPEATITVDPALTLGDLEHLLGAENPALAQLLPRCSYLRDEIAFTERARELGTCRTLDVLPPFAGG